MSWGLLVSHIQFWFCFVSRIVTASSGSIVMGEGQLGILQGLAANPAAPGTALGFLPNIVCHPGCDCLCCPHLLQSITGPGGALRPVPSHGCAKQSPSLLSPRSRHGRVGRQPSHSAPCRRGGIIAPALTGREPAAPPAGCAQNCTKGKMPREGTSRFWFSYSFSHICAWKPCNFKVRIIWRVGGHIYHSKGGSHLP